MINNKTEINEIMKITKVKSLMVLTLLSAAAVATAVSCGSEEKVESKSMQQLQSEQGIPVAVEIVEYKPFQKYLSYFSQLYGIKQTTRGAMIGGRIEKVNAKVGDAVKKDQVIVQFPTDSPSIGFEQAKSAYENAQKTYERMKTLLATGETSQANFDGAETQYLVAKRNYETQKQLLFLEAPYDGVITEIMVNEGDNIKANDPVFTMAQLSKMRAKVWATEVEVKSIKVGMPVIAVINDKEYRGIVDELSVGIDPARQAFYAEVEFDNSGRSLQSGVTADIRLLVYQNPKAVIIQRNLVMQDENGSYVFVLKNSQAEKRYIRNGNENGLYFEVSEGLQMGDKLIVKGASQLVDGTKVNVIQ